MGLYGWLSDNDFEMFSKSDDKEINEVLQQVREIDPVWYVEENTHQINRLLRKPIYETRYTIYSQFYRNGIFSGTEVYIQMSVNAKRDVLNFLYGLNTGLHTNKN